MRCNLSFGASCSDWHVAAAAFRVFLRPSRRGVAFADKRALPLACRRGVHDDSRRLAPRSLWTAQDTKGGSRPLRGLARPVFDDTRLHRPTNSLPRISLSQSNPRRSISTMAHLYTDETPEEVKNAKVQIWGKIAIVGA